MCSTTSQARWKQGECFSTIIPEKSLSPAERLFCLEDGMVILQRVLRITPDNLLRVVQGTLCIIRGNHQFAHENTRAVIFHQSDDDLSMEIYMQGNLAGWFYAGKNNPVESIVEITANGNYPEYLPMIDEIRRSVLGRCGEVAGILPDAKVLPFEPTGKGGKSLPEWFEYRAEMAVLGKKITLEYIAQKTCLTMKHVKNMHPRWRAARA